MSEIPQTLDPRHGHALTTAIISDSLDVSGYRDQVVQLELKPAASGLAAIGRAKPIQFALSNRDSSSPYDEMIDFIDSLAKGDLVVIGTDGSSESAFWGELFSAASIGHGVAGMVTDGYVRDAQKIARLRFPVFSRGNRPVDYRARMRVVSVGEPVLLGGVWVNPGDLVAADDDGVVVVPQATEREVLKRARHRASIESTVLEDLLGGESLRSVWTRHGIL